jgi:hypothetical protein
MAGAHHIIVIPAKAGIQLHFFAVGLSWTPTFVGVTNKEDGRIKSGHDER